MDGRALAGLLLLVVAAEAAAHAGVPEVHVVVTGDPARPFAYLPEVARLAAGQRLEWTNDAQMEHTATADDASFDVVLAPGASASADFPEPGTWTYGCRFHPAMRGTVEVVAGLPAPGPLALTLALALAVLLALPWKNR